MLWNVLFEAPASIVVNVPVGSVTTIVSEAPITPQISLLLLGSHPGPHGWKLLESRLTLAANETALGQTAVSFPVPRKSHRCLTISASWKIFHSCSCSWLNKRFWVNFLKRKEEENATRLKADIMQLFLCFLFHDVCYLTAPPAFHAHVCSRFPQQSPGHTCHILKSEIKKNTMKTDWLVLLLLSKAAYRV